MALSWFYVKYEVLEVFDHPNVSGRTEKKWLKHKMGPFSDRATAEKALVNLALNPSFRGGEVTEDEED